MRAAWLERLGKPGIVGLGILLFCLSFYFGNIAPAREELETQKAEASRLAATLPAGTTAAQGPDAVDRKFPPFSTATDSLKILDDLAVRHGVTLEKATYQLVDAENERRLEVTLPMKASYVPLRGWLRDVLALPESPSLEAIVLRRQKATDNTLDAEVRLAFHFSMP